MGGSEAPPAPRLVEADRLVTPRNCRSGIRIPEDMAAADGPGTSPATDTRLGRRVAVKLLKTEGSSTEMTWNSRRDSAGRPAQQHRFRTPTSQRLLNYGDDGSVRFMVMELVQGKDLGALCEKRRCWITRSSHEMVNTQQPLTPWPTRINAGVVHRDIKPSVMIQEADWVKVTDFGIVAQAGASLTAAGSILGRSVAG